MAAIEDRLELELGLRRHHELIGELVALVAEFPLRDRLHRQLMLALHRSGRTAEALQAYQQVRRMMIDELGIEPGGELQRLQHAILASDPELDPPAGPVSVPSVTRPVPKLLPADIADFTGRTEQVSQIGQQFTAAAARNARLAVPVVVISGQGGVGKTSLAVHAAHALAAQFEDGQLFADLHGAGTRPADPAQVLERFLRALGVPGPQIPEDLDERAEVYRNLLADRRVLVVLDNAASETQVLPLLPGSGSAAVLVTCRGTLAGWQARPASRWTCSTPGSRWNCWAASPGRAAHTHSRRPRRWSSGSAATCPWRCGSLADGSPCDRTGMSSTSPRGSPTRPAGSMSWSWARWGSGPVSRSATTRPATRRDGCCAAWRCWKCRSFPAG